MDNVVLCSTQNCDRHRSTDDERNSPEQKQRASRAVMDERSLTPSANLELAVAEGLSTQGVPDAVPGRERGPALRMRAGRLHETSRHGTSQAAVGTVLALYSYCTRTALVVHWRVTGAALALHWHYKCTALKHWCYSGSCTGTILVPHWRNTATALVPQWYCTGAVLVLEWYRPCPARALT